MVTVCFVQDKIWHFQLRKFHILYYPGMLKFCNHLIIQFLLLPLSVKWLLTGVKNKEKFKCLALKVVAVTYQRWSLTRGSKYMYTYTYF